MTKLALSYACIFICLSLDDPLLATFVVITMSSSFVMGDKCVKFSVVCLY